MGKSKKEIHRFLCVGCGQEGIPLPRSVGYDKGKFHKKKLYCPNCKKEINHIECRNDEEVRQFKENFEKGVYNDDCVDCCGTSRLG